MQYILTQQEYDDLAKKGNQKDHMIVLFLTDIIHKIATSKYSMAHRIFLLEAANIELLLFEQDGDSIHIKKIKELFAKH